MDNIVDILIILFFVISFLSSIFKKKKKLQKNKAEALKSKPVIEHSHREAKVPKPQSSSQDKSALEDILKSFLQVPEPVEETKSEVDAYFEEAMRKSALMETKEEKVDVVETKIDQGSNLKTGKIRSYTEAMKDIRKQHSSQKAKKIRESLHQTSTIRDYIVMNEILSKPIALRE
ncbi:MAG: hypothetical protein ABFS12_10725 [Bacteroidota bacterium]